MSDPVVLRFLPAAGASAVVGLVAATRPLGTFSRAVALACVVGAWAAAALVRRSDLRAHATVVASIAAAVAAGQVSAGIPYGAACALLLVGCVASMRAARARPWASSGGAREAPGPAATRAALVLGLGGTAVAAGLIVGLPRLAQHLERRLDAMFAGAGAETTAFSTTMVLGSTRGMFESDAIVLRIDGERPDYLRGAVYDRYEPPFWVTTHHGRARRELTAPPRPGASRITLVRGAPAGDDMRWFSPPNACDLGVPSGRIEIDAFGVARRGAGPEPATLTFRQSGCAAAPVAAPSAADLDVPARVAGSLAPIAAGWTASASTARGKLEAIERELGRFTYSLAVPRDVGRNPVVDFVTVHQSGHCEMFASAMALMARTQGIPARVVGGYRVSEVNPLTGRAVVRDRDAHAWVEAWIDGAWVGWDPTPASEAATEPGALDHVGDLASEAFDRLAGALARLGLVGFAGLLTAGLALLVALRVVGDRLARRPAARGDRAGPPLPCFQILDAALTRRGHVRAASEPIEAFARRVGAASAAWSADASRALLRYAELRYGGVGDPAEVERAAVRAARAVDEGGRSDGP